MFLDYFIGEEKTKDINYAIRINIVNIFSQRANAFYFEKLNTEKNSVYRYYGIMDHTNYSVANSKQFVNFLEKSIMAFETRIKNINIEIKDNVNTISISIGYLTYKNVKDNCVVNILR